MIESRGVRHTIRLSVDAVRQEPVVIHDREPCARRNGTSVTVQWPVLASSQLISARSQFLQIANGYALFNPHAALRVEWDGKAVAEYPALDPAWTKWGPSDPTSAHWYDPARFERLVAAYASQGGERTVREFVNEFRGLTSTKKVSEVLQASGLARTTIGDLFDAKGKPSPSIRRLLREMQAALEPGEARRSRRHRP